MLRCRRVSCLPHNLFRGNIAPTLTLVTRGGGVGGGGHHMDPAPARTPGWSQWPAPASSQLLLLIIIFSELHYLSSTGHCTGWAAHVPCPSSDIRHISSVEICGSLQSTASPSTGTSCQPPNSSNGHNLREARDCSSSSVRRGQVHLSAREEVNCLHLQELRFIHG